MLSLSMRRDSLKNAGEWSERNIILPSFSIDEVRAKSEKEPTWLHFGAGNIFRGFIARLSQDLLNQGLIDTGIIAADTFDYEIIDRIYRPYDDLTLMVDLRPDGSTGYEIIGSVTESRKADPNDAPEMSRLYKIASSPSLQIISFTITEKGYALYDMHGKLLPVVSSDMENGPKSARHAMSIVCALLWERFQKGGAPLALASMDNCSSNGKKLQSSILEVAEAWEKRGFVSSGFIDYLNDTGKVSFPWSMIDKITPRPDASVEKMIEELGISDMRPFTTAKGTFIAPFVNAEVPQYLVIEDTFPNGRPPLEKAGVFMTDRDTVNKAERMKVTTCLNPLHTALAVFGCVLGYTRISAEMKDDDLRAFIQKIGYMEAMPVVVDPGVLNPYEFIGAVINRRLPNPFMPDAPQRIAMDTSQKLPIRFGETLKKYIARGLDKNNLVLIPLTLAGYARYLKGIKDDGTPFDCSPDPMLEELQAIVAPLEIGKADQDWSCLKQLYSRKDVFGLDLYEAGLGEQIKGMVKELYAGNGAVRATLHKYVAAR